MSLDKLCRKRAGKVLKLARKLGRRASVERVHDFRVALRRLELLLDLLAKAYGADHELAGALRLSREAEHAFSPVRSSDAAAETAEGWEGWSGEARSFFLRRQKRSRRRKIEAALEAFGRLRAEGWEEALAGVLRSHEEAPRGPFLSRLKSFQAAQSRAALARAMRLRPSSSDESWHRLRKSIRALRYAAEIDRALDGAAAAADIEKLVEVQEFLGGAGNLRVFERKLERCRRRAGGRTVLGRELSLARRQARQRRLELLTAFDASLLAEAVRGLAAA